MKTNNLFSKLALNYDRLFSLPVAQAEKLVLFNLMKKSGVLSGRILDVGCGTGGFLETPPGQMSFRYTGVDNCGSMLKMAQAKNPNKQFILTDFLRSNNLFVKNSFNNIIALNSLQFMNMPEAIKLIYHLLKPGGKYFIVLPTPKILNRVEYSEIYKDIELDLSLMFEVTNLFNGVELTKAVTGFNYKAGMFHEKQFSVKSIARYLQVEYNVFGKRLPYYGNFLIIQGTK